MKTTNTHGLGHYIMIMRTLNNLKPYVREHWKNYKPS